ncbi:ADP-ribosylation factor GTPase activating protein, ER-Golgi transport [Nowakowskiella sp. JEL0407]|nr:ADP-ribosylation factor GTPase activating protein, ER-Golgi transport [Nowakowskiella sp. JEL0407]
MGVHISFVRSTLLDSWTLEQLRQMKVGGNANALEFFKQYGGTEKYKDAKSKYTSKAAGLYKDRLRSLVDADSQKYPGRIVVDSLESSTDIAEKAFTDSQTDDFFADWNVGPKSTLTTSTTTSTSTTPKPAPQPSKPVSETAPSITPSSPRTPSTTASKIETSPVVKSISSPKLPQESPVLESKPTPSSPSISESSKISTPLPQTPPPAVEVTPTPISKPVAVTSSSVLKSSKKGLGAKKATKVINFDEAERKAKEEAEKRRLEEEEERKRKEEEEKIALFNNPLGVSSGEFSSRLVYNDGVKSEGRKSIDAQEEMMERLGMGFGKVGFGATSAVSTQAVKKPNAGFGASSGNSSAGGFGSSSFGGDSEGAEAVNRFGKAKAISSDQYFKRGGYDESESAEVREKLRGFEGKSGFGSDDYFGRNEEGNTQSSNFSSNTYGGSAALGGNMDAILGSVGESAREFALKFAEQASEDLNSLNQIVRSRGQMLGDILQDLQV